jgi:gliding motility-associated-like protein
MFEPVLPAAPPDPPTGKGIVLSFFLLLTAFGVSAQCNTTLNKLLAERSVNNDDRYGSAMAANSQYMVVAAENSDTLGIFYGGAAYVYEKTPAGWAYRAMLVPSDPVTYDFFGNELSIDATGNTIVVINRSSKHGGVYVYERPPSGWQTMTETARVKLPDYLEYTADVEISDDGGTIAVTSPQTAQAKLYMLRKQGASWASTVSIQTIIGPDFASNLNQFGMDILLQDDYLYVSSDNDPSGNGIYVYKFDGSAYQSLAKLSISVPLGLAVYFGRFLTVHGDILAATAGVSQEGNAGEKVFIFKRNGEWTDAQETAQVKIPGYDWSSRFPFPIQLLSSTQLAASIIVKEGEYYTGKLLLATASGPDWQNITTSTTLYAEEGLSSLSEFAAALVWNGSDLIRTVSLSSGQGPSRNGVLSLTRSGEIWGSEQFVMLPRNNSSNVNFGSSVLRTKNVLFAGAPFDGTMGRSAGAVYVYEKSGDSFVKFHTIYPSHRKVRPTGGSDAGFGYSLAMYGDELAVGAPYFRSSANTDGKIFLYKRVNPSWSSAMLYDSLIIPDVYDLNHVGATLTMNERYLFASAYNNFNNEHTNAIVVFEKINDRWTFQEILKGGKPLDKSWPSVSLSMHGDDLVVGEYVTIDGGVKLFSKDPVSGHWTTQLTIYGNGITAFGASVKMTENHLFVGAPDYAYNGVQASGVVAVFTRLPGTPWDPLAPASAIVGAQTPIEGGFFGWSVDAIGNTMIAGAPGTLLTGNSVLRTVPGNTYIIQAQDYFWTNTTQYLNLQGDRYNQNERDQFGYAVDIDEDYMYIGARNENTSTGMFSGSVYYIPSPPIVFLEPPICGVTDPIQLNGYPFGGTWSGTGIEDPSGLFSPALSGSGIFTLTYITPNCNYPGTVQIEVKFPEIVSQLSEDNVALCNEGAVLHVESIPGTYEWYYKQEGGSNFVLLGPGSAEQYVTNTGQYYVKVVGSICPAESPVFTVFVEDMPITIGPQPVVCERGQIVSLLASPKTGTWEGPGVVDGKLNPANLTNATYELTYLIDSPSGCKIAIKDSIRINVLEPFAIERLPSDFCETGSTTLKAHTGNPTPNFVWYYHAKGGEDPAPIQKPLTDVAEFFEQGYYYAVATNADGCSASSEEVIIGFDDDLSYDLSHVEDIVNKLCNATEQLITVQSRDGTTYGWEYSARKVGPYEALGYESSSGYLATRTGFYKVSGEYGFCSFESKPVYIEFATDSVFVPNVFTPNGDQRNETFRVLTTQKIYHMNIFNRYGTLLYSTDGNEWDGGDATSGSYFWQLEYEGCEQRKVALKGWVNLLR